MSGDLVIMTFNRREDASETLSALEAMRDKPILGLDMVALATRDKAGHGTVHTRWRSPAPPGSQLPRIVADSLVGNGAEGGIQVLSSAGLDEDFLKEVKTTLGPNTSALFIYIPTAAVADVTQLVKSLGLFRGKIFHTTCPTEVEKALLALT
jgi:uncharacterized membrane protein